MLFDRRLFLKSLGIISGGTFVSCDVMAPREKLAAYLTPPVEMIPGKAAFYATVCRACPAGCGILVKTREGRPIKLEGNPAHPINRGRLCARGQAFVQDLYNPHRIEKPLVREGGAKKETEWRSALTVVSKTLAKSRSVGFITGLESSTFDSLIANFGQGFEASGHVTLESSSLVSMAEASELVFGMREVPRIDLSEITHVVSLGADFLDTWLSPVELSRQWVERHAADRGRKLQLDYIGPHRNLTATSADRWHRVRVSQVGALALGVLEGVLKKKQRQLDGETAKLVSTALQRLSRGSIHNKVPDVLLKNIVNKLTGTPTGLLLFGGTEVSDEDATAVHAAVLLTNTLLGSVGKGLRYGQGYAQSRVSPDKRSVEMLGAAAKGSPEILFITGTNPVYTLPGGTHTRRLIKNAKMVVALAHSHDETTDMADVVLPIHHPLESWGDFDVTHDISGLMQPVRAPLYATQHPGELLLLLREISGKRLGHSSYKGYLTSRWAERLHPSPLPPAPTPPTADAGPDEAPDAGSFEPVDVPEPTMSEAEWEQMLVQGGYFRSRPSVEPPALFAGGIAKIPAIEEVKASEVELVIPFGVNRYDGRGAALDWLRETPDPLLQTAWDIPVEVAEDIAEKQSIGTGDLVKIKSKVAEITAKAVVSGDLARSTLAFGPGGGRSHGRHQRHTGNPFALLPSVFDGLSGQAAMVARGVTVSRESSDSIISVMGSPESKGRLLALDMGLDDFKKGRFPKITRHGQVLPGEKGFESAEPVPMPYQEKGQTRPKDNMYSLQAHEKHRWGLLVDLDKCTGCGACVVACYAENNIPVVGPEEVAKGRELSWIRIEKHEFPSAGGKAIRFLPVMCQQCDNAPCESVCPVFASAHTTDGLNAQIYNRCVGTRYCANNCPYKVRRFNFFDYKRPAPANEQLNPDVTVRSRGVMEKCTFCIQRIREAQSRRKLKGGPIRDGDIVPACVQTCPTGALVFGDFNEPKWRMSELARDPRGYRLLDYAVNTRPGVVYLRKVTTEKG